MLDVILFDPGTCFLLICLVRHHTHSDACMLVSFQQLEGAMLCFQASHASLVPGPGAKSPWWYLVLCWVLG